MDSETVVNQIKLIKSCDFDRQSNIFIEEYLNIIESITFFDVTSEIVPITISELLDTQLFLDHCKDDERINKFLHWLCEVFTKNKSAEGYALQAITKVVKCNPKYRTMIFEYIFSPQSFIYSRIESEIEVVKCNNHTLHILECADVIFEDLPKEEISPTFKASIIALMKSLIRTQYSNLNSSQCPHVVFYTLILLKKLTGICKDHIEPNMNELLGISLGYMSFGIQIKEISGGCPKKIKPSQYIQNTSDELDTCEPSAHQQIRGKFTKPKKNREKKCKEILNPVFDSIYKESTLEKCEYPLEYDMKKKNEMNGEISSKIRIASIALFGDIIRSVEKRVLYSYWQSILPFHVEDNCLCYNDILVVCQSDLNSKCRGVALQVFTELLLSLRSLLSQAEFKERTSSFLPFSQMLGISILAAYKSLTYVINNEESIHVLIQSLKCLAALVDVTPLIKLGYEIIYDFVAGIKSLLINKDFTIQVSALTVLEMLLIKAENSPNALHALGISKNKITLTDCKSSEVPTAAEKPNKATVQNVQYSSFESSWLISKVLTYLKNSFQLGVPSEKKIPLPLRIKSIHLLTAMSTHFELFLKDNLEEVAFVIEKAVCDEQFEVRLYGSKCLEACTYHMGVFLKTNLSEDNIGICKCFWIHLLPIITNQIKKENETVAIKITLCDAISNIGASIFETLPEFIRINLLSFLSGVGCDYSEDVQLRATIVRTLSVFVTFPSMRLNLVFIENTAELILRLSGEGNMVIRIKVIWSMGNVTDSLLENINHNYHERISDGILWQLIQHSTEACNDNDKVRCNAVRTLGNLLRLLTEKHFSTLSNRTLIKCAIIKLIDGIRSSGTSKVKWNSCYAVGNMLQNENIFLYSTINDDMKWQSSLYTAVCDVISGHPNYKVKINATMAVIHICRREYYGEYYEVIWSTALTAVEQSHNLINYYEYNHRDQLQEKLCYLISHMIELAHLNDFIMLSRILLKRKEVVKSTWIRVLSRMIPEKAAPLLSCLTRLEDLLKTETLSSDQNIAITHVIDAIPSCF
ncbi:HEAT repeat-containing protein 6 [Ceratitis capitata]|uniref:HEAT repeat-containing protein 6 n=1 Tax=Ceratitis capitata TaxID=7213 RepID=UPI0003299EBF|nr:HEAT repeat-containing protein 6 [Ceratitis capitata]